MAFKFIAFATLVAAANAGLIPVAHQTYHAAPVAVAHAAPLAYAAPVTKVVAKSYEPEPYDAHPQYSFSYDVHDSHTGDLKSQQESRDGDVVQGSYSFVEADGSRRVVHYTADDHNGFNAVVEKQPAQVAVKAVAPVVVKSVAPVTYAHPVAHPVAHAPVAYHPAPVAHATYAAPLHTTYAAAPVATYAHGYAAPALTHSYYH